MTGLSGEMTLRDARAALGVDADAPLDEIRKSYRALAKTLHPDRSGGEAEAFQRIVTAYRRLAQTAVAVESPADHAASRPEAGTLEITPLTAWSGGSIEHRMADGKTMRIRLPLGLRNGDVVRIGGEALRVAIRPKDGMMVRGDDLWITVQVPPRTLNEGGRVPVVTPIGRRILWVDKKAGERRLLRAPELGLPPRGRHAQGCLFVRLTPKTGPLDSAARMLLHRFAAAWAA